MTRRSETVVAMILCSLLASACGGGEKQHTDTTAIGAPPSSTPAATPGAAPAIVGKTWDVKMLGDATGYRFDPPMLTIKAGDGVRWTVVSGPPHNVTFWPDSIPPRAEATLRASMTQTIAPLTGPLLVNPSLTYTVGFVGAPPGTYHYYCTPHLAVGMKGVIVVQ